MINGVNQDMDLIAAQKDELTNKTRQIDTIMNNITLLKDKDNEMTVLTGARKDSLSSASDGLDQMNFSTYIFIGINILILLVILGLVIYIVYSSYSAGTRARSANNLYSGIARNTWFKNKKVENKYNKNIELAILNWKIEKQWQLQILLLLHNPALHHQY